MASSNIQQPASGNRITLLSLPTEIRRMIMEMALPDKIKVAGQRSGFDHNSFIIELDRQHPWMGDLRRASRRFGRMMDLATMIEQRLLTFNTPDPDPYDVWQKVWTDSFDAVVVPRVVFVHIQEALRRS